MYYIYLELYKCTVTSVSELAYSWGVFQYTVCSLVLFIYLIVCSLVCMGGTIIRMISHACPGGWSALEALHWVISGFEYHLSAKKLYIQGTHVDHTADQVCIILLAVKVTV